MQNTRENPKFICIIQNWLIFERTSCSLGRDICASAQLERRFCPMKARL